MPTRYLDEIVVAHRRRAARDERDWRARREATVPRVPRLRAALRSSTVAVIAEVKRRSPSRGTLAADLDPAQVAREYRDGGAAAISVLTDEAFFGGSLADLGAVAAAVDVPLLRKDFAVSPNDVLDAATWGASGVLLIVAALNPAELAALVSLAREIGLDPLVEVHDADELARALDAGADLIGINQRDLHTFAVEPERAAALAQRVDPAVVLVAESGIRGRHDATTLARAGIDALLVGESVVTAANRRDAVRALTGITRIPRG
ncbi:MAG: indole-3-glycerol phosphate synthase TrpC [Acidimicrobiales bacterium]